MILFIIIIRAIVIIIITIIIIAVNIAIGPIHYFNDLIPIT